MQEIDKLIGVLGPPQLDFFSLDTYIYNIV